ncbi:hyaluronoglucosaminidase [Ancylostoma caninum]|uniref:Hyaluronidase n=1 Tax=Ancylostoma caninum TaxID=29170 RepID=A0A368H9A3_ANCCA|nr:hyaluronoglucosaminidase [Ancylostoma caninum]
MDAQLYKDILVNAIVPWANGNMPQGWILQQDNDPKHTSRLVKQALQHLPVTVLEWPSHGPDLNPIEHIWQELKKRCARTRCTNRDEKFAQLKKEWKSIPPSVFEKLIDSMPSRCDAVIKSCGFPTNYYAVKLTPSDPNHSIAGHEFLGDQIVIFYEYNFGYFPYYVDYDPNQPVNGGLPQNCPLAKHLALVSEQIREAIPREDFDGIAVIDFEEWRPLYQLNWGKKAVYKKESIRLVRQQYPSISEKSAEELAKKEFNAAAKKIFLSTIGLARQMRPYARWGFYGFPYCNYDAGNSESDMLCSEKFRRFNDEMSFIFEASSALFPSIYLSLKGTSAQNYRYIQAIMVESARIASLQNPVLDVYPYTKFEYNPYQFLDSFYAKKDVCNSLKQAADLGARGIVLWSSSKNMKERCDGLAAYVRDMLGPHIIPTIKLQYGGADPETKPTLPGETLLFTWPVRPSGTCISVGHLFSRFRIVFDICAIFRRFRCTFRMQPSNYVCRCDPLFTGSDCSLRRHFQWIYNRKGKTTTNGANPAENGRRNGRRKKVKKIKKIRYIKVSGEAGGKTEDGRPATAEAIIVGVVTPPPLKIDEVRPSLAKTRITVPSDVTGLNVTIVPTLVATHIPPDVTTPDTIFRLTPPPLDFRLV